MKRQRIRTNPVSGEPEIYYEDLGRKAARPRSDATTHPPVAREPHLDVFGRKVMPYSGSMRARLTPET